MSYPVAPLTDTNSRQSVQTIRPPSTSLLTIDSEDRFKSYDELNAASAIPIAALNATPYNFAIRKSESLMNGFFTRIGITEINFPWGIPNINEKSRQIRVFWQGPATPATAIQTITIPEGFYTPFELAAAIQAEVQNLSVDLVAATVNYGIENGTPCFTYQSGGVNPGDPVMAFVPMINGSADYPYPNTTKQLFNLMGFTDLNLPLAISGLGQYTFCQFTRYVDICCFQLTNNQALKDQTSQTIARDALCRIYLGDALTPGNIPVSLKDGSGNPIPNPAFCPPGCAPFTIYRNFTIPKQIQWIPNQPIPGFLAFQVYDDSGQLLSEILPPTTVTPLPPDAAYQNQGTYLDWSMTMLVSEN